MSLAAQLQRLSVRRRVAGAPALGAATHVRRPAGDSGEAAERSTAASLQVLLRRQQYLPRLSLAELRHQHLLPARVVQTKLLRQQRRVLLDVQWQHVRALLCMGP